MCQLRTAEVLKMNYLISNLVIFGILSASYSVEFDEQNRIALPLFLNSAKENISDAVGVVNSGLSSEKLTELHDLAKNISRSKGIYREHDKETDDDKEVRRSILRKAAVASESAMIKSMLQTFDSNENKLELLEHIEYLVHQYDVAVSFATLGGLKIITPFLFSSDDKITSAVASVLGAAMQSNPVVQKLAMNEDMDKDLLKLLTHKSPHVVSRIIFVLACFLRNAPEAQEKFIAVNGVSKLADILRDPQATTNTKLKIINLFNDLVVEQETIEFYQKDRSSETINALRRSFSNEMQKCEICKLIPSFLNLEDFDTHQKIIAAMLSVHNVCHNDFKSEVIKSRIKKLLKIYDPDSIDEDPLYPTIDKDLKRVLHTELKDLIKKNASKSTESSWKIEL